MASDIPGEVFAKLEFLNPMGSSKDRIARYMIEKAEKEGKIKKGDLIIENSSGNTAMGLALIAIQKGYRLKVVVRDRISREKLDQLKALGVEIHMVDSTLPPESPYSYNNITPLMARETPNCFFPDQHNNRDNNEAHYLGTGPEIWEQMDGQDRLFRRRHRHRRHHRRHGPLPEGKGSRTSRSSPLIRSARFFTIISTP